MTDAAHADVDAYLAALPDAQRIALEALRAQIKAAAPDATETISYQIPTFKDRGRMLVSYAAFKGHLSLFPATRKIQEELGDELAASITGKGTIRFTPEAPLSAPLVTRIVKLRLEENEAVRRERRERLR